MKYRSFPWLAGVLSLAILSSATAAESNATKPVWDHSLVLLDVTRKQYDYFQPWTKRVKTSHKMGLVLSGQEILTTADEMFDRTLVRIQKGGRGRWWTGAVTWIDYHANLALVTAVDEAFWQD